MALAPIGISVYTRLDHFRQCVEALQKNTLASGSELFIYSDAPGSKDDEKLVQKVRAYSHSIEGFKRVHVIERATNFGGSSNAFLASKEITEKYGKSIFLEDDIITAPGFLNFMNGALNYYRDDERILSITGYCPPIEIPADYKNDLFVLPRFNGWGSGSFVRTIEVISTEIDKEKFYTLPDKRILTIGGEDVLNLVEREIGGEIRAGDVRCMFYQAMNNVYTVYPRYSLARNIGHDGSGVHCSITSRFNVPLWDKMQGFIYINDIKPDERIVRANQEFRRLSKRQKVAHIARRFGIYPILTRIRNALSH